MSELIEEAANAAADPYRLLTVNDAADYLAISRAALYNLLAAGELRSVRIGRSRRVALMELRDFVESRSIAE